MKPLLNTILFVFAYSYCNAQGSFEFAKSLETKISITEKTIFYKIADNTIPIKIQQYGERSDIVFINLHDDEATSVDAAKKILEEYNLNIEEYLENEIVKDAKANCIYSFH